MVKADKIFSELGAALLKNGTLPGSLSQPVIRKEDGIYYLASFVFFFTEEDIRAGAVERPGLWVLADMETGEIKKLYDYTEKDFSDAPYGMKYNIRAQGQYDISDAYYSRAFAVLDSVREKLISAGKLYRLEYEYYLKMILANIPPEYQRFFRDLSV